MSGLERYYTQTAIPNANKHSGRVPNMMDAPNPETTAFNRFVVHAETPYTKSTPYASQALVRIHTLTPLNERFFSDRNIKYLQDEIRFRVWDKSGRKHIIDTQNPDDLKTIMRSYYLQYSGNDPRNVEKELEGLNERVLVYSVDYILCEINMYLRYRKDQSDFPVPIQNPVNANLTGTKSAEFKSFF